MSDDEYFQSKVITLSNESRTEIMQERNKRKITQSELAFQINIPKKDMRDIGIGKKITTPQISVMEQMKNFYKN
jgi:ribosome-binding protein aMBF1 (putative translation factor)